jgi:hypothetical protein
MIPGKFISALTNKLFNESTIILRVEKSNLFGRLLHEWHFLQKNKKIFLTFNGISLILVGRAGPKRSQK